MSENGEQPVLKAIGCCMNINTNLDDQPVRIRNEWTFNRGGTNKETKMAYFYKIMKSPVGALKLVATDKGLAAILWENDDPKRVRLAPLTEQTNHPLLVETERQLKEYFEGKRTSFSVDLDPVGTKFQTQVWHALSEIPFGETSSYGEIAKRIGQANASRAVGAANGKNPISIIVPCHRVIGASGKLTGFAGGLKTKEQLLTLEAGKNAKPWKSLQGKLAL